MLKNLLISICVFAGTPNAFAGGLISECASSLVIDSTKLRSNYAVAAGYSSLVTKDNFDQISKSGALDGMFGDASLFGSYDEFSSRRAQFLEAIRRTIQVDMSSDYAVYALSGHGAKAFSDCVESVTRKDIVAVVEEATRDVVIVLIRTERSGELGDYTIEVQASGGDIVGNSSIPTKGNAELAVSFQREQGRPFLATVNMRKENERLGSDTVHVPRHLSIILESDAKTVLSDVSSAFCGGHGSKSPGDGNNVSLTAPFRGFIDVDTINIKTGNHLQADGCLAAEAGHKIIDINPKKVTIAAMCSVANAECRAHTTAAIEATIVTEVFREKTEALVETNIQGRFSPAAVGQ